MEPIKYIVLILLVLHTSFMVLTLRYTRTVDTNTLRYLSSTVVLFSEVVKAASCIIVIFIQAKLNLKQFYNIIHAEILSQPYETLRIVVPAGVYAMQNNLLFIALSYLDAATYQVTYQLKILSTAIFSVVLLKQSLSSQQWLALVLLTIGVGLVQLPAETTIPSQPVSLHEHIFGFVMLLLSCVSSGFAGVYFEMVLKQSSISLWIRNLQMALFATFFAAVTTYLSDRKKIQENGIFQGYNWAVVVVLLLQAYGGLLVASVVQYANTIIKSFATSLSIILSTSISLIFFQDLELSANFVIGTIIVLASTSLYGRSSSKKKKD